MPTPNLPLTDFKIEGLFGKYTVTLPLSRRPIILIGPNGTGKTTVISVLNLFLTGQWSALLPLPFDSISFTAQTHEYNVTKDDISLLSQLRAALNSPFGQRRRSELLPATWSETERLLRLGRAFQTSLPIREMEKRYATLQPVYDFIIQTTRQSILYYPTYRRIEREIAEVLSLDELEHVDIDLSANIRRRFADFGEVIGFGGQDIQHLLSRYILDVENEARQALNEHSVRFLELLYQTGRLSTRAYRETIVDAAKVERLLERINTLAPQTIDKSALSSSLSTLQTKIRQGGAGRLSAKEDVAVFYIAQLLNVFQRIDVLVEPLQRFCDVITRYLEPLKKATFDEAHFKVSIIDAENSDVELEKFSSGEKQVISLFAFLMFSQAPRGRILLIDEPELSLSVVWQKRLLADLLSTRRPDVLVTATHSPFIFEGFDLRNTIPMDELLVKQ